MYRVNHPQTIVIRVYEIYSKGNGRMEVSIAEYAPHVSEDVDHSQSPNVRKDVNLTRSRQHSTKCFITFREGLQVCLRIFLKVFPKSLVHDILWCIALGWLRLHAGSTSISPLAFNYKRNKKIDGNGLDFDSAWKHELRWLRGQSGSRIVELPVLRAYFQEPDLPIVFWTMMTLTCQTLGKAQEVELPML